MGNSLQFSIQGGVLTRLDNETAIYPGTVLRFSFEDDWGEGVPLFALFRCGKSATCFGQALAGDMCIIPVSMAERAEFFISVSAGTEETNLLEIRNSAASGVVSVDDLRDMIRKVNDCMSALLPTGGKTGDALLKKSDADHDTEWGSVSVEDNATVQQMAKDIADLKENGAGGGATGVRMTTVALLASAWTGSGALFSQVVEVEGVTENSKVDPHPSPEQMQELIDSEISLTTVNENGVVTVYAIGGAPASDYTMNFIMTEVQA